MTRFSHERRISAGRRCRSPGRCSASCWPCEPTRAPPTAAPHLPPLRSSSSWLRGGVVVPAPAGGDVGGGWLRCEEGARWRASLNTPLTVLSPRRPHPAPSGGVICRRLLLLVRVAHCLKLCRASGSTPTPWPPGFLGPEIARGVLRQACSRAPSKSPITSFAGTPQTQPPGLPCLDPLGCRSDPPSLPNRLARLPAPDPKS